VLRGCGTIFEMTPAGTVTKLHATTGPVEVTLPSSTLTSNVNFQLLE
jgi:hypothetical protein